MRTRTERPEEVGYLAVLLQSRESLAAVARREYGPFGTAGKGWLPSHYGITGTDSVLALRGAVGRLSRSLLVLTDASTRMVVVTLEAPTPGLSVAVGNALLEVTDSVAGAVRRAEAEPEREFLRERAAEARARLEAAEGSLAAFDAENRQLRRSGRLGVERRGLEREVARLLQVYLRLENEHSAARRRALGTMPALTVVDAPSSPRRTGVPLAVVLAAAAASGLIAGVIVALGGEYLVWQVDRHPLGGRLRRAVDRIRSFRPRIPWRESTDASS